MRIIDRLATYLAFKNISAHAFERSVDVANGYLKKQTLGKGSIGSDILQRIYNCYPDLDFIWLLTGQGEMICGEGRQPFFTKDEMISLLRQRIAQLERSLTDKEKLIRMLESVREVKSQK